MLSFQQIVMKFFLKIQRNFLVTALDKRNSITATATCLILSLLDVTSAGHMLFGILQYVQCILHGHTSVLLCVPFILARC